MVDILNNVINVGDVVAAPFGKDYLKKCVVISLRPKTCLLKMIDDKGVMVGLESSKHYDSLVIIDSITQKLEKLGF
jgi:hypothetical protein